MPHANYSLFDFMSPTGNGVDKGRQMYHALMTYLDGMIGELRTLLEEEKMWSNTILVS